MAWKLPDGWSKTGSIHGEPVDVVEFVAAAAPAALQDLEIEIDGETVRPFRHGVSEDIRIDGDVVSL